MERSVECDRVCRDSRYVEMPNRLLRFPEFAPYCRPATLLTNLSRRFGGGLSQPLELGGCLRLCTVRRHADYRHLGIFKELPCCRTLSKPEFCRSIGFDEAIRGARVTRDRGELGQCSHEFHDL